MMSSLVKRISKSLSLGRSSADSPATTDHGTDGPLSLRKEGSTASNSDENITSLRRQSTRQLSSEGEGASRVISVSKVTRLGSASRRSELSKRVSLSGPGKQLSSRLSRPPSRLIEQEVLTRSPSKRMSPSASKTSVIGGVSLSRSPSKTPSRQGSKTPVRSLSKKQSLSRTGSKASVAKSSSVKFIPPAPVKKVKPGGKVLWFPAGAYLSVRNDTGGFYLCRAVKNVYNTSKEVKIRWLAQAKEIKKKTKRKAASTADSDDLPDENEFKLAYADQIESTSILMQVSLEKKGAAWILDEKDREETERLLHIAEDVETGHMDKDNIGDDVQEVIIVEPPAKKRKTEAGSSPKEKKPRLKKTASQKERDKEKKVQERKEKKEKKKDREGRKRKVPKKEEDLMLHPNPKVKVMEKDPLLDTNTHVPYVSKYANSRLAFRAIKLNDIKMLKKLLKDSERVKWLTYEWSVMNKLTALEYAVMMNNVAAVKLLWEDYFGNKYDCRTTKSTQERNLLDRLGTGSYNFRSLGIGRIRKIMASRGAREGNNALTKDKSDMDTLGPEDMDIKKSTLLRGMVSGASTDLLLQIMKNEKSPTELDQAMISPFMQNLMTMLLHGHNIQAAKVLTKVMIEHHTYRRLPGLLLKVLEAKSGDDLRSIPLSQITFKSNQYMKGFTLIHAAACNPDPSVLEKVLDQDPNFLVADANGRRPIHFAAGCSSSGPLKLLLQKGANPFDADSNGATALHKAVRAGRTENVEIILKLYSNPNSRYVDPTEDRSNGGINRVDKSSWAPLHRAAYEGHIDIVKLLIEYGANVDMKMSINQECKTPLMLAACRGHLDIVRVLVDAGAVVQMADRFERTALIHAAMNGATTVLTYLLNIGASPDRADSSGNNPLHYAAAYGWYFPVKVLLEAGSNPAVSNDWRTTPLSVAYLKGHHGIVSLLLEDDRTDINFPDDQGQTLLAIACSSEPEPGLLEQIRYLVEEKGADVTAIDNSGKTPLHHLAAVKHMPTAKTDDSHSVKEETKKVVAVIIDIAKLLLEHGCDPAHRDKNGYTAAMIALEKVNIELAQCLVEKGSEIYLPFDMDPNLAPTTILHNVAQKIFEGNTDPNLVIDFLTQTLTVKGKKKNYRNLLLEMAQTYDSVGNTALLSTCHVYSSQTWDSSWFLSEKQSKVSQREFENARKFLRNLVVVAKSDVNAVTKPRWISPSSYQQPSKEDDPLSYWDQAMSKSTPIFYLLKRKDPFWDRANTFQPNVTYVALKDLLDLGAEVNVQNLAGKTPLTLAMNVSVEAVRILLTDDKVDVNRCETIEEVIDGKKLKHLVPPICLAARAGKMDTLEELLKHPVQIDARDGRNDCSVLHFLANQQQSEAQVKMIEKVIDMGINLSMVDCNKMTPLHFLVSNNKGGIDDSLDCEILLISHKAPLALPDKHGRIPLHYAFMTYGRETDVSHLDPAELCKLLVKAMKKADLSRADNAGRTPLHYAAQRGAGICCMYLLQKGADPNVKDKDENTPLALAVKFGHNSCAGTLIQHGVDLQSPVVYINNTAVRERDENRQQVWRWKPMTMVKNPEPECKVPLFQESIKKNLVGVSFLILEWPQEKSGITLADAVEMAVKNMQYNIALRLLATTTNTTEICVERNERRNLLHILALFADSNNLHLQKKIANILMEKGVPADKSDSFSCTPMLYAAMNKNYGLATFFSEVPGVLNVKYMDSFGRSLVAAALWNCYISGPPADLWEWLEMMINKKVDINQKFDYPLMEDVLEREDLQGLMDPGYWQKYAGHGTTPLIFLIHCRDFTITHNILQWGANPNLADANSLTPLMHAVKLNSVKQVKQLLKYDYDPNVDDTDPPKPTPTTQNEKQPKQNVFRLKKIDSIMSVSSSECEEEEEEEEEEKMKDDKTKKSKEFRAVKKTSPINLNMTDSRGWTALHYAVCPQDQGTFDNDEIVFVLGKAGAKLNVKNDDGQTPLDLALTNNSPRVATMLQKLEGVSEKKMKHPNVVYTSLHVDDGVRFDGHVPDFHSDADQQLVEGEKEMEVDKDKEPEVGVCEYCNVKDGTLAVDDEQGLPYEVLMTKCDVRLGMWGLYNFYQIQLVHQAGKDLYILFTRWGRIGDKGQYQHTPFQKKDAAVKEFCKIFREKSGNKWTDVKNFEQKPRKYRLVPWSERKPPRKQKQIEFALDTTVKSALPDSLEKVVKIMMDVKVLENSYKDIHLNTDVLPFGRFSREKLLQAKQLLEELGPLVNKISKYRSVKEKSQEEKNDHQADCEKVSELSTEYYQLIPQKKFVYEQLRPLDQVARFQEQFCMVTNLLDFEVASRMLLGAMHCRDSMNPMDYIYRCLRCKLELMDEEAYMAQCILHYIYANSKETKVEAIYKVQREGEDERLRTCGVDNRRYLWHGTQMGNLLSILSRGLLVSPLDVSTTGSLFGKGIYFSDLFEKSLRYCGLGHGRDNTRFMLLCEVALGKQRVFVEKPDFGEGKKHEFDSIFVHGRSYSNPEHDVRLSTGVTIPLGKTKRDYYYEDPVTGDRRYKYAEDNEFVVQNEKQVCIRYLVQFHK